MTPIVIDASVALSWVLPSQSTAASSALLAGENAPNAPDVLRLEIRNALLKAERRGLLEAGDADAALNELDALIQFLPRAADLNAVYRLGRAHGLSFFDACYLDCALSRHIPLASRDAALIAAAHRCRLKVEDLR